MTNDQEKKKEPGLRFTETMSGYMVKGVDDFEEGERKGKEAKLPLSFDVTIEVESVSDFLKLSGQRAEMSGTLSCKPFGENLPIREGVFTLFIPDAESGTRQMTYSFWFTAKDGADYSLYGYKVIRNDPGLDIAEDMTKLFTRIYTGRSRAGSSWGAGVLRFHMLDLPSMIASFEVTHTHSPITRIQTIYAFARFCYGEVKDTYLRGFTYDTRYENLVLSGKAESGEGGLRNVFFFSGIHGKDFPWGDGEVFWDIAFVIHKADGPLERYALTDRRIENLFLDVEKGIYRYDGPIYQIIEGYKLSQSETERLPLPPHLRKGEARIEIRFDWTKYGTVDVPFPFEPSGGGTAPHESLDEIAEHLRRLGSLGLHLTPGKVRVIAGKVTLTDGSEEKTYLFDPNQTMGEAEVSTFKNVRWPTLYYNYFCCLDPADDHICIKMRSDVLRKNRTQYLKDEMEKLLGKIINHVASVDVDIEAGHLKVLSGDERIPFTTVDENLLEINNDHFPTGTFQRRVVTMADNQGRLFYALEEDMDPHILKAVNSEKTVRVVAFQDADKFKALRNVLDGAAFFEKLDQVWSKSGKRREDFSIIIKPNFMFMYSTKDRSTYTDPELVECLIDAIYDRGYRNLAVAEARSTYGTFFTNREVRTVAGFIGLKEKNYHIIDLSLDLEEYLFSGKLGRHCVNREWKNADFRISFAKNKTHVYAYYTLTIKDIYGALPMENKFLEYHHERDIFSTTIEFIRHFPVHFALIDAYVSADGPFGIFADKKPNETRTIIGSEDLVATDWLGAEKMGLDPMVSQYMEQAVAAFGKPRIELVGDRSIYPGWVNVWDLFPPFLFGGLDKHYYFGNLFYSIFSYMDPFFQYKDPNLGKRFARLLADPIKKLFFQKVGEGTFDRELNRKLYNLLVRDA